MNKTYRIVWNETTNTWVAVAEIAKAHGKSASVGGGIVASCTQVGARFAFTAAASAVLMMGAPAMAANGTEYQSGTDNLCYYDTTSHSVVCGSNATNTADTSGGKPAKSVVMGLDSTNTGESNVTIGYGAKTIATHSLKTTTKTAANGRRISLVSESLPLDTTETSSSSTDADGVTTTIEIVKNSQPSSAIAIGQEAKAGGGYGIALGYQSVADRAWDISIGRNAGAEQNSTQAEGRNIAIGDGALRGATSPNNNIAMGTDAGRNTTGTGNVIIGTYANSPTVNSNAAIDANNVVAIGDRALAAAGNAIAIGSRSQATKASAVATGVSSLASGEYAVAQGSFAQATSNLSVAIGGASNAATSARATNAFSTAVGYNSASSGRHATALGSTTTASGLGSTAVGAGASTTKTGSIAISAATDNGATQRTIASGDNAVAIGVSATASAANAIAQGTSANAGSSGAIAIGVRSNYQAQVTDSSGAVTTPAGVKTTGENSIAIGTDTNAAGQSSNAIGNTATATGKDSASFGSKATATHESALAVGSAAQAINTNAVAVGGGAVASKVGASALGRGANATGTNAVAVGIDSLADKDNAVAVGVNSKAQNNSNIAVGNLATATGNTSAIAVGRESAASGTSSIATGYKSAASTDNSIAIGNTAAANGGAGAIAVGKGTTATGTSAVVMGTDSQGTAQSVVVIGNASNATKDNAVAIGIQANATGSGNVAIGANAGKAHSTTAQGNNTVLIGVDAGAEAANNQGQVSVGWQAGQGTLQAFNAAVGHQAGQFVNGENNVAFGKGAGSGTSASARLTANDTVSIGTNAKAIADNGIAIGNGAQANAINTISIGTGNVVSGEGSGAIGDPSTVSGTGSYSLGNDNIITTDDTFVIGNDVTQTLANSVILGDSSSASQINTGNYTLNGTQDANVAGKPVLANGVVSVGSAGAERQIQNVAAGVVSATSTDAINGSQLYAVAKELKDGQTHYYSVNSTKTATGDNYNNEGATGQNALAAGVTTSATGTDAVAIGSTATASGNQSLAVGNNIEATHLGATAVGNNSRATADGAQAFGQSSQATAKDSAAMGRYARATAERATAVGIGNLASGVSSFAGGDKSTATGAQSVAIGLSANSAGINTIAMGNSAQATKEGAIAIGTSTISGSTNSVVLGTNAKVERDVSTSNVIIGHNAKAVVSSTFPLTELGKDAVAIGFESQVGAASNVAIGSNAKAIGNSEATAIGYNTDAKGYQSAAFGSGAKTSDNAGSSLALGKGASATVANGVALGSNSVADVLFGQTGADPLNAATDKTTSTWKATHAAVSVGKGTDITRQITSVAAGTNDTDAVNVAQLKAAGFTLAASHAGGGESTTVLNDKIQNGETVTVDAGKNIKVTHTANQVSIATKDDVAFTTVTTTDAAGNQTVLNGTGMTITPTGGANPVSLTNAGLNNGGNKITNVADGNIASGSKEAVNGGQIFDLKQELTTNTGDINKGLNFAGNSGGGFNRKLGETTTISGGLTDTTKSASNTNIRTVATNGTIDIQLADAPVFTGKVSAQGLDAGNQKITNVAKGSDDADAVNVKQLQESLANITVTNQSLVQANSPFSYVNSAGEQLIRHVDGSGNITFTKASDGSTYANSDITISALNPSTYQTATPTIVGNIADGKANNDAVNVSQLKNAVTALGAGAAVNADGSITKPTYTVKSNTFDNVGGAISALDQAVQTPLTFSGDNATEKVERKLGTELAVKGGSTANLTEGNIGVVGNATDNSLTIKLAEKINLGATGSVTTGDTKIDNAGVTIASTGKTPVSLTNAGLNNGGNVISNVGAGKASTDAVNVSQLTPLATALGVNVDPNSGIVAAPSFVVTKTDGSTYAGATTIQGALDNIGTEIQKGITFAGNSGQAVKKLGETFNIKGTLDSAATASDKNIRTEVDSSGVMSIKLAESPKFGNVTINDAGKITGVTAGTADTDAVNVAQLNNKTATTPLTVGNTGAVDTPADTSKLATAGDIADAINKVGFTLTTAKTTDGELGATATNELINAGDTVTVEADKNIKVTQTNGKISIATKDAVSFNNVTVGNTTIDNSGITIKAPTGGTTTDVKLTAGGLDNGGNKITNVANGDVTSTSKDAINGSQLRNTADDIASIIGGNAAVDNAGNVTASNIGGTTATTIDDAIKTVKTTVKSTDNTIKVTTNTANANDGTVFDISVDSQKLAESAQLPVVYTKADGTKVYKVGNSFFDNKDGTGTAIDATDVIASMQNADGTTSTATKLANIAKGEVSSTSKDAINGSQLFAQGEGVQNIIGGNTTYDPATGTYTNNNIGGTGKGNINDAIQTVNTKADANATEIAKGLNFGANDQTATSGDAIKRQLGETIGIKGGITDTSTATSGENVITRTDANGNINIELAKNAKFDSVTTGGTKLSDAGLSFVDTSGSPVANSPSISKTGINAGNQVIAGVKAGTQDTDAVNVAQLNDKTATTPLTVGNTGAVDALAPADTNKLATAGDIVNAINKAGFTLTTAKTTDGELGANSTNNELINAGDTVTVEADKNIKVTQTNGKISIATKDAVSFNSVTAGTGTNAVVLDDKGVNIGGNTYISDAGLNANDKKITNVANGNISANSKDAINGSQLHAVSTATKNLIGSSATVNSDGTVTASNIGGTGANTIDDAIKTVKTTVKSTDNTIKVTDNTADATNGTVFDISVDSQKLAESAQLPVVYTDADGNKVYKVGNKFTKDPTGQDASQEVTATNVIASMQNADGTTATATKLANIAKGDVSSTSKDAINGSQLFAQGEGVKNIIGGNTTYNPNTGAYENNDIGGTGKGNINDAIQTVNTKADANATEIAKGLNFGANDQTATSNTAINRKLGETIGIKGGITDTTTATSGENVITRTDANGNINIELAKNAKFDSVTTGGTKLSDAGLSFVDTSGSLVANSPSISKTGINAGNQVIAGVKAGTQDTDAVNVAQLNDKTATTPLTVGNTGAVDTPATADTNKLATAGDIVNAINKAGFTLTTAKTPDGELGANSTNNELINAGDTVTVEADKNIKVTQTNGKISIATKDAVSFNSVTAGTGTNAVVLDDKGVNIGGNTYISDAGLNANDKKIINVANGDVTSTSKDAINGSQLHAVSTATKNLIGSSATVNSDGTVTASNIGGTGANTIDDAIKTVKTTVKSTDNTIKVTDNTADATNGTVFDISVDAQKLAESAQLPVVYTDADGNKVYKVGGKFTKDPTGQDASQEVTATNVIASMQNADGTISPTTLANIKAGTKATDAVNVSQLKGAVDALGGGAAINADGTIKAPTYNITNPANGTVTTANNVGDALKGLNDAVNNPLTFVGDSGNFTRNLGQTTTVKGGITDTAKLSDNNIGVVAKDGTLDIKLAKDIAVDSVKTGDTTVNTYGVSIANADPNKVVSLTASGLNNGNNRITNVVAGQAGTDAVNKDQLDAAKASATTKVVEGKNVKVSEKTNDDGSKTYTVATADEVVFDKATVGGVVVDGTSNKISGLANGDVSATSTDAINGSQLFATNQNVANNATEIAKGINFGGTTGSNNYALGDTINVKGDSNISSKTVAGGVQLKLSDVINVGTAKPVKIDGTKGTVSSLTNTAWDADNIVSGQAATEDQLKSAVSAAQAAATTKVVEGKNVKVTEQPNADGSTTYTVATADEVAFDKATVGNVTIDSTTNKISGLANGDVSATSTDAINGSQLFATNQNVANNATEIAKGINVGGTTGSNNYALGDTINVKGDSNISSETVAGGVQLKLSDVINVGTAKPVKIDGTKGTVSGLTNTAWDADNIVSGQAATEDQLKSAVSAAQAAATTKVVEGKNVKVTEQPNADGSTTYTVATADDLDVTSVKAGDTTLNNAGVTVGDKVALTNTGLTAGDVKVSTDGINAGNKVITGVASGLNGKTLDQIKADPNAAERTNAASIGDLAEVQSNVTNITNNVTNITNNVLNGNTKDANGNTVTYVDDNGNLTDAGKVALTTYNVSGQTEFVHNSVISAIQQMNNEGIKYFHTNDGQTPVVENTNSQDSSASGKYASAVGYQTSSSGENATAVGSSLTVTTDSQTAGATITTVTENGQTVLKQRTTASGARAVALGAGSQALGADSIAIGTGNVVSGKGSGAIGDPTVVTGDSAYSIGNNNTVSANNAYALGSNITANVADSVYLGDRTTTSGVHIANPANGSTYTYGGLNDANVAGVTGSTATANNVVGVVAVGNNADEVRQIQGVAAGVVSPTSTDAINGSQLYDTHQAIGNVANYTVNMGNQLNQRIDGVEKRSNAGTAAAMAVAGLPQAYLPGKSMMAVSGSTYRGESGYAVGFSSISDNGNWIIKGSATGNSRGHYGATAGVGYQW